MLSSTQTRPEIQNGHGMAHATAMALAFGTALTIDHLAGAHGNATRQSNPEFHVQPSERARQTLGVLPGCQSDGKLFFNELSPLVRNANLVVAEYPQHGFNVEAVCEGLGKALVAQRKERPSLLCESIGGMVMNHFLRYAHETGVAEKLGGFGKIVLDSSPFDIHDVGLRYRGLLLGARLAKSSWSTNYLKPHVTRAFGTHSWDETHVGAIWGQARFMHSHQPTEQLPDIMDSLIIVQGPADHIINTEVAAGKYLSIAPEGKGHLFTDYSRKPHTHCANTSQLPYLIRKAGITPTGIATEPVFAISAA